MLVIDHGLIVRYYDSVVREFFVGNRRHSERNFCTCEMRFPQSLDLASVKYQDRCEHTPYEFLFYFFFPDTVFQKDERNYHKNRPPGGRGVAQLQIFVMFNAPGQVREYLKRLPETHVIS